MSSGLDSQVRTWGSAPGWLGALGANCPRSPLAEYRTKHDPGVLGEPPLDIKGDER